MKKHYDDGGNGPQGKQLWEQFNEAFSYMPLAALVAGRILCMHGGLSPSLTHLNQIRELKRPIVKIPESGIETDLLWADPDKGIRGFVPSSRGISHIFGADAVVEKCEDLELDMVTRAHQVVDNGFEFFAGGHLVTLFTAPDYCEQFTNAGGVLTIEANMACRILQLPSKSSVR